MSLVRSTRLYVLNGLVLRTLSIRFYSLNVHTLLQKVLMLHFCRHKYNNDVKSGAKRQDGARYARYAGEIGSRC